MRGWAVALAWGAAVGVQAPALASQSPPSAAVEGRVTGADAVPIAAAHVRATSEEGQAAAALTDADGRYRLVFARPSARFVVSAHALGRVPATRIVRREGAGPATADFSLEARAAALDTLMVSARAVRAADPRRTPGVTNSGRNSNQLRREALQGDELADLATRGSGAYRAPGSEGGGVSFAGQSPDQTRATLDGASLESAAVPREAIRGAAAVTNSYDVARGQFTGGQLAVQTQRGDNAWGGAVRLSEQTPWLRYGDWPGALGRPATGGTLDAGGGGALVRDRVFAYGALTVRHEDAPSRSLENLGGGDLRRLRASPDSVRRFIAITDALGAGGAPPAGEGRSAAVGLLRLDATLSRLHSALLRFNGQSSRTATGDDAWARAGSGAETRVDGGGVLGQLTSGGMRLGNTLRVHHAVTTTRSAPTRPGPTGTVLVGAAGPQGGGEAVSLLFGGNPFADLDQERRVREISDEVAYVTRDGAHRVRAGVEWRHQELGSTGWANRLGTFGFAGLGELEQSRPASYTRALAPRRAHAEAGYAAGYLGHHWVLGDLKLDYGLRAERSWYPHRPAASPAVEARFGRAPGRVPSDFRVSPRLGGSMEVRLPWDRNGQTTTLQGGVGEFGGTVRLPSLAAALGETGLADSETLVCLGSATPAPRWGAPPEDAPTGCVGGASEFASRLRRATLFAPGFAAPRVWRGSVNGAGQLPGQIFWQFSAAALRGSSEPLAFDRNLLPRVGFTLAEEGGRPVYVPASAIEPTLGAASVRASRRVDGFGTVREVTGEGRSRATQLSGRLGGILPRGRGTWDLNYTWTRSRLRVGPVAAPGAAVASVGPDPLRPEWADAPYSPRHILQGAWNLWPGPPDARAKFQIRGQLASGLPFTPTVGGDVNGDGAANDRAFVWAPGAAPDSAVAGGMRALLERAPGGARACLRRQLQSVAAPNSCRGSGWASLDLAAELQFGRRPGTTASRFTVWLLARNVPAGVDRLLHGTDGLRGWGQPSFPDPTLLSVRGFDRERRAYRYEVNPRFGSSWANPAAPRTPFTVSVQARLAVGRDPAYRNPLGAASQGAGLAPARVRAHLRQHIPNHPAEVLASNGPQRLELLPDQAARLQEAADLLGPRIVQAVDSLEAALVGQAGPRTVAQKAQLDALVDRARALVEEGAAASRAVLSPAQAARLPRALREPDLRFPLLPPVEFAIPATDQNLF